MYCGYDTSFIVSIHIKCQASIYTLSLCRGHSWRMRLAKQETITPPGHLVLPLVGRGPWMSTVVLYCWCHSDSASVNLYLTSFVQKRHFDSFCSPFCHDLYTELDLHRLWVVSMEHLQRVWHASRERLPFRTPGSVPHCGTCLCSNCWDQIPRTCHVFTRLFTSNTSWYFLDFASKTDFLLVLFPNWTFCSFYFFFALWEFTCILGF